MDLKKIKELAEGTSHRPTWRLRTLEEETQVAAQNAMVEGAEAFQSAFANLEEMKYEDAVASLRRAAAIAEQLIEQLD